MQPTMTVVQQSCIDQQYGLTTLPGFCNNNERLLKSVGFIKDDDYSSLYKHKSKYSICLDPCLLAYGSQRFGAAAAAVKPIGNDDTGDNGGDWII